MQHPCWINIKVKLFQPWVPVRSSFQSAQADLSLLRMHLWEGLDLFRCCSLFHTCPSGHMTFIQCRISVDTTSWRFIDVVSTLSAGCTYMSLFLYLFFFSFLQLDVTLPNGSPARNTSVKAGKMKQGELVEIEEGVTDSKGQITFIFNVDDSAMIFRVMWWSLFFSFLYVYWKLYMIMCC